MAVLLHLDEDADEDGWCLLSKPHLAVTSKAVKDESEQNEHHKANPNINGFSTALGCYP